MRNLARNPFSGTEPGPVTTDISAAAADALAEVPAVDAEETEVFEMQNIIGASTVQVRLIATLSFTAALRIAEIIAGEGRP